VKGEEEKNSPQFTGSNAFPEKGKPQLYAVLSILHCLITPAPPNPLSINRKEGKSFSKVFVKHYLETFNSFCDGKHR